MSALGRRPAARALRVHLGALMDILNVYVRLDSCGESAQLEERNTEMDFGLWSAGPFPTQELLSPRRNFTGCGPRLWNQLVHRPGRTASPASRSSQRSGRGSSLTPTGLRTALAALGAQGRPWSQRLPTAIFIPSFSSGPLTNDIRTRFSKYENLKPKT